MGRVETNIFAINNLSDLSTEYRLFRILGLRPEQDEFYQNIQHITRSLSYQLRAPVTTIERDGGTFLVVPVSAGDPQSPFPLVRSAPAIFELCPDVFHLDYTIRNPENDRICLRFLQFLVQAPLRSYPDLWQPGSGQAFFRKRPADQTNSLARYFGFSIRATLTPDGGLGFCVDVASKIVSNNPLPSNLSRDSFPHWKGTHCVYHYGHQWYEIRVDALSDLNVSSYLIQKNGGFVSLLDYIVDETKKPLPTEMNNIPYNSSVVLYHDHREAERAAPTALCYPVLGPENSEVSRQHQKTILPPHQRRGLISEFVRQYVTRLKFGSTLLNVSSAPIVIPRKMFIVPDLEFGQEKVLSVKGTPGTEQISLDRVGSCRLDLLQDKKAGFYSRDPLERQYFILPKSLDDSCGKQFIRDLKKTIDTLFPQDHGYDPVIVTYNDRGPKTITYQSRAVLESLQKCTKPGYAVIMVHDTADRKLRDEDQLAAMALQQLRGRDIFAATIHTNVVQECYQLVSGKNGEPQYSVHPEKRGKLTGYLRNVALNKVLLTNQRWPFVLAEKLNADVTIGIDVKNHTAGLVVVGSKGGEIRSLLKTTRYKEQLYGNQLEILLTEILKRELSTRLTMPKTIVIHRDGRTYPSEIEQAKRTIAGLKLSGGLDNDASLTILEIPKSSPVPFRMFEITQKDDGRTWVENPQVGYYHLISETDGYVCSTGRAFSQHPGTVQPLHVRKVYGNLSIDACLEDIYSLTTLAWTRPEDCTRYPITIKLNDRFLVEDATEYDPEYLEKSITEEEVGE